MRQIGNHCARGKFFESAPHRITPMHGACPGQLKHPAEFQVHPNGHALGVWVMFRLKSHSLNSLRRRRPSYGRPDRSVVESLSIACDTLYAFKSESFPAQAPVREKPLVEVAPLSKWSRRNLFRLPRASRGPGQEHLRDQVGRPVALSCHRFQICSVDGL